MKTKKTVQSLKILVISNIKAFLIAFIVGTIITSCSKRTVFNDIIPSNSYSVFTNSFTADPNDTTSSCLDWNHPALEQMRSRAEIIANILWIPKGEVPKRDGVFPPGVEVTGIPYSSVKELNKFVGREVSFYTFLSAVNNPRSVLYTENVGLPPYHGTNCAAYYGTVCSGAVNYALGLDRPYSTDMYASLPFIKRVTKQDIEHAAPGDIVYVPGHVFLITNILKNDDDNIQYVDILECAGSGTFTRRYTKHNFQERLDNSDYIIYRYMDLQRLAMEPSPYPAIESNINASMTNNALSLDRGDRVTYRTDECVVINVLEDGYDKLEVYKIVGDDEIMVEGHVYNGTPDIVLTNLAPGIYKAVLTRNDGMMSDAVSFEILQTNVSYSKRGNCIDIQFDIDNAIPEYIVFCERNGSGHFVADITDDERQAGYKKVICKVNPTSLYLKVFFRGEYGRVSNSIIPLD